MKSQQKKTPLFLKQFDNSLAIFLVPVKDNLMIVFFLIS